MTISCQKKILFFCLAILMAVFFLYVQLFATRDALMFIGVWNIDKLVHIAAGVFIAIFFEWIAPRKRLSYLLLLVGCIAVTWEIFEITFLPDVIYFHQHSPDLWRLDTAGDITAGFLGAYSYWVFFRGR